MPRNLGILVERLRPDHKLSLALNGEMALQIAARTPSNPVLLEVPEVKGRYCTDGWLRILLATKLNPTAPEAKGFRQRSEPISPKTWSSALVVSPCNCLSH